MEQIKIMYHTDIEKITKISVGDWIDLRAADNIFVPEGEYALIPLGVSMKLPEGYEAHIVPRSSTFKNWGLVQTNHCGVIDSSYCGNDDMWMCPVYCLDGKGYASDDHGIQTKGTMIKKNDRICQFRIMKKQPVIAFVEVDHLEDINRGGFGSTGKQ